MIVTLWGKLLRDIRVPLLVVLLLLAGFELLWVQVTHRITTQLAPALEAQGMMGIIQKMIFESAGKVYEAILGGEQLQFQKPAQMLMIGYLHPFVLTTFCIWSIGRAAGAVAGEIDRGTMELLLAQPLARTKLILAHLAVDLTVIPLLCLAMLGGTHLGLWIAGPFTVDTDLLGRIQEALGGVGLENPGQTAAPPRVLQVDVSGIPAGLCNVAAFLFAVSGLTVLASARGRFRWWVVGQAVMVVLVMFLINVLGQLWDQMAFLRPFSVFYYYQPQRIVLDDRWTVELGQVWNTGKPLFALPMVGVLTTISLLSYLGAGWIFARRDIPAPL